jgi:hypothetical protein
MAITRAQQAKQMLREGGRIGFFKAGLASGDDISPGSSNKDTGEKNEGPSARERYMGLQGKTGKVDKSLDVGGPGVDDRTGEGSQYARNRDLRDKFLDTPYKSPNTPFPSLNMLGNIIGKFGYDKNTKFFDDNRIGGKINPQTNKPFGYGIDGYKAYSSQRSLGQVDAFGNPIDSDDDNDNNIFLPVDTTFNMASSDMDQGTGVTEEEDVNLFRRFAADGGIMNANVIGGEYDFESARQMYGLGKLVKKVTRTVKKIAKSPIGKAAIIGGLGYLTMGGSSGGISKFFGKGSFNPFKTLIPGVGKVSSPFGALASKFGITDLVTGSLTGPGKAVLGLGIPAALSGFLTPKQEEEAQSISDETGIDIQEIRNNPDKYLGRRFKAGGGLMRLGYADGTVPSFREYLKKEGLNLDELDANIFSIMQRAYDRDYPDRPNKLAEGGKPEPVAKKTMPLIDMDGQEMDFRAEGGFVPIGRMERADDVPARLSKNEFVFTADAVRNAGDGSVDKGAEVMYNMMKNLEAGGDVSEESQGLEGAREMFQTSKRLEEVI